MSHHFQSPRGCPYQWEQTTRRRRENARRLEVLDKEVEEKHLKGLDQHHDAPMQPKRGLHPKQPKLGNNPQQPSQGGLRPK
ncbi:hypothetical protein OIU77_009030 [Salix suchowensis]|uniref:Uncharacterized protein n=1 Tax=Salix suchowensis TaxID=1278906 RepID=A0ABQ9ACX5_9ROSI|nr:hypothetical protein OIU77_009030 [Salix suchowensis]